MSHLLTDPHDHHTACQHPWFAIPFRKQRCNRDQSYRSSSVGKMWVWACWDFPCGTNPTALVGGGCYFGFRGFYVLYFCNEAFCTPGDDLRRDQCNSSSRWDKPHSPPALPGVLFPSLHHLFPPPLQPSHHHLREEKLSVLFNLLPTVPKSHNLWGRLENAQLGTAGGGTAGNSWEQHSNIPSSSLFTPQSSPAALSNHCFYFIAGSFSFSSRKLEFFFHSFYIFIFLSPQNSLPAFLVRSTFGGFFFLGKPP